MVWLNGNNNMYRYGAENATDVSEVVHTYINKRVCMHEVYSQLILAIVQILKKACVLRTDFFAVDFFINMQL